LHKGIRVSGYRGIGVSGYRGIGVSGYRGIGVFGKYVSASLSFPIRAHVPHHDDIHTKTNVYIDFIDIDGFLYSFLE
jgi:hypothetical protein